MLACLLLHVRRGSIRVFTPIKGEKTEAVKGFGSLFRSQTLMTALSSTPV